MKTILILLQVLIAVTIYSQTNFLIVDNHVNIRTKPDIKSEILGQYNKNKIISGEFPEYVSGDAMDSNNFWIKTNYDSVAAYVNSRFAKWIVDSIKMPEGNFYFIADNFNFGKYFIYFEYKSVKLYFNGSFHNLDFPNSKIDALTKLECYALEGKKILIICRYQFGEQPGDFIDKSEIYLMNSDNLRINKISE